MYRRCASWMHRARHRGPLQPAGCGPSRHAADSGSAGSPCARPGPCSPGDAVVAASRSPCSRARSLSPTYMSAVARRTGSPCFADSCKACSYVRIASRSRPWVIRMSARAIAAPSASERLPDRCTRAIPARVDAMRGLEVPARPCGQPQERLCCPAEEIVVLGSQIECLASVPDGRRDVASDLGKHGSVDRDQRRQAAELAPVHDNHLRPPGSGFIWHTVGRREPALAVSADGARRPRARRWTTAPRRRRRSGPVFAR